MKRFVALSAPALIALCFVGFAAAHSLAAAHPLAAPSGVTMFSTEEGVLVSWDQNDAAAHWVAWMNDDEYQAARDAGDWTTALNYAYVPSGDTHVVSAESLIKDDDYWFIVGSESRQAPSATSWSAWQSLTVDHAMALDDALTRAYVDRAIAYYDANGLDATTAQYKSGAGVEDGRQLTLLDAEESVLLVYRTLPTLEGQYVGPGSRFPGLGMLIAVATEEGHWDTIRGINPVTKQEEPRRVLVVLHDGLVFTASHSALTEDVAESTREYVRKAIAKYDEDGLEATIAHYNRQDSLEGQFYLFLIGADDNYLAHPIFPHLIGTDIKEVVGSDGQELGKEIARATEEGVWVEYLWPHPVTRKEQQKVTWAVRHDGLIFASGYYAGGLEAGTPPWQDADPREYTVEYVERAIERYERDGLESMLNYYNSVASFEGEWYLFATDANDIYHVHPLLPRLIGTDIKDVVGSDGYELGKALAQATEEGVWVEYLWPHPVTLKEVPKVGYAVRRDGMLFASGYYVQVEDPAAQTQAYVQQAVEYYQANGLDATIAHYNSQESVDGQWSLTLADENDIVRVALLAQHLIGTDLKDLGAGRIRQIGREMAAATEEGLWVNYVFPNVRSSETLYAHSWAIRYDGLLFTSRYYDDRPDVPGSAQSDG
ncbi:MAG: cache domain-containing protein [Chloroflexi bacterium]|nr:cache domain-containing protein [Chloroflexota bacterium]